jgi:hypothetical protein
LSGFTYFSLTPPNCAGPPIGLYHGSLSLPSSILETYISVHSLFRLILTLKVPSARCPETLEYIQYMTQLNSEMQNTVMKTKAQKCNDSYITNIINVTKKIYTWRWLFKGSKHVGRGREKK